MSLYAHIPFCERRCHYCDFYSTVSGEGARADFLAALHAEAQASAPSAPVGTLYVGGGTPSVLDPEDLHRALAPWAEQRSGDCEWTVEANPSSLSREKLRALKACGVNRLSIGVQSLDPELLTLLGRAHDRKRALAALDEVFSEGFENVSVDLLCGVPGQSIAQLEESASMLLQFPITHLSCYLLTLEPGHPLHPKLPSEEVQLEHLLWLDSRMREAGFEHYEVSNFCRPGRRSRHNMNYWTGGAYRGIGPSAHSFDPRASRRWKNISDVDLYVRSLHSGGSPEEWSETLDETARTMERWMLSLRLADGVPTEWFDSAERIRHRDRLVESGLLEAHPDRPGFVRATPRGFFVMDEWVVGFL